MKEFKKEVYIAYGVEDEVLYVGQGNIGRNAHCYSGASHNKHLNRYYFLNGEDGSIRTEVVHLTDCEQDSLSVEIELIKELSPICNSNYQAAPDVIKRSSFKRNAESYYEMYLELKACNDSERVLNLKSNMSEILNVNIELAEILEILSIEGIKSTSFNKTKSRVKYNKVVGVGTISRSKASAFRNIKIKEGDFLLYSEIKDKIQKCFDRQKIDAVAKATDIKDIFNVKRTTRGGVEGFLIGEKI